MCILNLSVTLRFRLLSCTSRWRRFIKWIFNRYTSL